MNRFEPVNSITESVMKVITEEPKSGKKSVGGDLWLDECNHDTSVVDNLLLAT